MKSYQEKHEKCREMIKNLISERRELSAAFEQAINLLNQEKDIQIAARVESERVFSDLREIMQKSVDQLQLSIIEKNDRIDALSYRLRLYESRDIAEIRSMLKTELREELALEVRAELSQELRDSLQGAKTFIDRIYGM